MERKKSNKGKNEVAEIPDKSHERLGPTLLAHLDSRWQKSGLGIEIWNPGVTAVQNRWGERYSTCSLTAAQGWNATLLPGNGGHTPEVDKTSSDLWEIQVGHHGSSVFEERWVFCAWPTSDWSKEGDGKAAAEAKNTNCPNSGWNQHLHEPWTQPAPHLGSCSAHIPQTRHYSHSCPLFISCQPTLLNWALPQQRTTFFWAAPSSPAKQNPVSGWTTLSDERQFLPTSKAQLLKLSELFFFSPYPVCKQHKLVIKKIQPSESFMMVWAREKFADQRL